MPIINAIAVFAAAGVFSLSFVFGNGAQNPKPALPVAVAAPKESVAVPAMESPKVDVRAETIDSYFSKKKMPLAGYGKEFVAEADRNGIDWRLLPAIAIRESSGGLHQCGHNPFGWASCKGITFGSIEEAINTVARHLGGNATSTRRYYSGDTRSKLNAYNPPSIVAEYTPQVVAIMQAISPEVVQ